MVSDELRQLVESKKNAHQKRSVPGTRTKNQEVFRGDRLQSLRGKWALTQTEMAGLLNCSRTTIANVERGWQEPSLQTVVNAAKHFDVTTDWLLGLED